MTSSFKLTTLRGSQDREQTMRNKMRSARSGFIQTERFSLLKVTVG